MEKRIKKILQQALLELLATAPQGKYLADMLGLYPYEITTWRQKGAVSRKAALLVGESQILGRFFDRYILRPDVTEVEWQQVERHFKTQECRGKMRAYERSARHAQSAIGLWMSHAQTLEQQLHKKDEFDIVDATDTLDDNI